MQQVVRSDGSPFKFEGTLGAPVTDINNLNQYAQSFLPYNPTIVEVGAYEGAGTVALARTYPYGRIFACEPNPRPFAVLSERLRAHRHATAVNVAIGTSHGIGTLHLPPGSDDGSASLLPFGRAVPAAPVRKAIGVPVVPLDAWCGQHAPAGVEFLRLDAGGLELRILQSSPRIVGTALVVVARTYAARASAAVISFPILKLFLEMSGFELLSHWYEEGAQGEAMFVRKVLYDSIFG